MNNMNNMPEMGGNQDVSSFTNVEYEVKKNDDKLMRLAYYYESKGLTYVNPDQISMNWNIIRRFSEFKNRVLKGSLTINNIEEMVYGTFGLFDKNNVSPKKNGFGFSCDGDSVENMINNVSSDINPQKGNKDNKECLKKKC